MDDRLEERVAALERTITDGHADDGLPEAARMDARLDELEATVDDVEDRVAELDAAVQALRGFAGGVRAVDEAVERRADAAVARVDRLETELAAVREAVSDRDETSAATEPGDRIEPGIADEPTGRNETGIADEPTGRDHAAASPRDARTTSQRDSGRHEPSVAGDRSGEGGGRVGDHDDSLTGEVAAHTDAALADAAAMEAEPDDANADDRSLAERIRRLL
jgi:uncharacterized coiled-coil protein SlyX